MISMNFSFSPEYASFIVFFGCIWLVIFVLRKELRREMLIMSLLCVPLGPLADFFYMHDYYQLPVLNGSLWFGFSAILGALHGGVTAVLYEACYKVYFERKARRQFIHPWWFWSVLSFGIFVLIVGTFIYDINSIFLSMLVMIVGGASILCFRQDLLRDAVGSGLILMLVTGVFFVVFHHIFPGVFALHWHNENLSGILINGAPLEEYLWAFAWGFVAGPAYEYVRGLKIG